MLVGDQCGTIIQGIVTNTGRIVIPAQPFLLNPGRWGQRTACSDDAGLTWQTSNTLDVGSHGYHDGAMEGAIAQLTDASSSPGWLL